VTALAAMLLGARAQAVRAPGWQQVGTSPIRYVLRLEDVSGMVETPKLVPPGGVTVIAQFVGGGLAADRVGWTQTSSSPWVPAPGATAQVSMLGLLRPREAGGVVGSTAACAVSGVARYFDVASSYPPGASGSNTVAVSTFGAGSPAVWTASGAPVTLEVTPNWTLDAPAPHVQVSHGETYSLDLMVTWQ
jgi:hypothetical protein